MDYGAISIDTSIFDQKGLKLESGILKTLEQFNGKPSPLILSEIIVREVHNHLKKKATESRGKVTKAIKESISNLSVSEKNSKIAINVLIPKDDDNEVAKKRLTSFISNTNTEIIPATGRVELDEVIKKYFHAEPPFAESGKKKNEFPDAIALMSLESWAKEHQTKILAVAKDKDWGNFAEQSKYIDVIEDLAEAIAKFQPHSLAIDYCTFIAKELPNFEPKYLYENIHDYLVDAIGDIDIYPEASSSFIYEVDDTEVVLDDFSFIVDNDGNALLQPIQGQNETLIIEAKIDIAATVSASFSLSVRDSIDGDDVYIGSATVNTEVEFQSEILFTMEGDFEGDTKNIDLINFELLSYPKDIDFGEIEPDWEDEYA